MGYLKEFLTHINRRDFQKFVVLWEEYCASDEVDVDELLQLLRAIQASPCAVSFGAIVETAIPLWRHISDEQASYEVLKLLVDLQTANSPLLKELILDTLKRVHGDDPRFEERLKLIGIRNKEQYQGALSKYDLLAHMAKGRIVFHAGGWGTGEIIDISFVREHVVIEFEYGGRKDLSFTNAFKTLVPLPSSHFLARRFSDADQLEKEGKEDPVGLIRLLLRDLGPQTAAEIKHELCDLVIPEQDWGKWWQNARGKLRKDTMIQTPDSIKDYFYLRKAELLPEARLQEAIRGQTDLAPVVLALYNALRDTPAILKNVSLKQTLHAHLSLIMANSDASDAAQLQAYLLKEQFFGDEEARQKVIQVVNATEHIDSLIQGIDIIALKKRALIIVKEQRADWRLIFLNLLSLLSHNQLRDYLLVELNSDSQGHHLLVNRLQELVSRPTRHPELFVWYFQQLVEANQKTNSSLPFQGKEGIQHFFQSFFLLLHALESQPDQRDLIKKMYGMLTASRYALVRKLLQDTDLEEAQEILLLASKCHTLSDHDRKILRSLAEVVHPSLAPPKQRKGESAEEEGVWITEEGYLQLQDKIRQIGTIEMIENAREIEAARALGDLRENSEFKFALERKARLQLDLTKLSSQLARARILYPQDVPAHEVGIGSVVRVSDTQGKEALYKILGPWEAANWEQDILSFNSKLAQAMMGKKVGERFDFREKEFRILQVDSYFNTLPSIRAD